MYSTRVMLAEWQNSKLWNLLSSTHTKSIIYWPVPFVSNPEASWEASVPQMCYETGHIRAGRKTWFAIITTPSKVPYNWEKNPSFKLSLGRGGKNWIICPMFWFFSGCGLSHWLLSHLSQRADGTPGATEKKDDSLN